MDTKKRIDMVRGPITKNVILYTIPIILTGVLQLLFNAADLVVVGRFGDETSIAAVGATGAIINLIVNLFTGLSVGAGVTIAHAIGAGNEHDARATVHTAIPMAVIGGGILMCIGIPFARPLLTLMQNPPDVIDKSTTYMQLYFCGIIGSLVYNYGASIMRAVGDTKSPLIFLTVAGVVNVLLNLFFVIVFDMDVAGVALATSISQTLSAILVIIALSRRTDCCKLEFRRLRLEWRPLSKMIRIGIPAGIQGSLFSISNVIIQSSINSFGSTVMAGHSAAANIEGFLYTAQNAFYQTALNFTGQNVGAQRYRRVKKVLINCMSLCFIMAVILGALSVIFSEQLLSIYITDSPESIKYGMLRMSILSSTYFLCGLMEVSTGMLRGMGKSLMPMIVSILGVCVLRVGWVLTIFQIPEFHTLTSLYVSYPISWTFTTIVQTVLFVIVYRKTRKLRPQANVPEAERG